MTDTPAGQPETPVAVLFGRAKGPPAVAAEQALGPRLAGSLSVLERLPGTLRKVVVGAVIASTVTLLDFSMIELLVDGWREHHDLTEAARHTLAKPGNKEIVALATHRITVSQRPSIDILLNGERVATVELELTLLFDISAAVAEVRAGMMTALHSGRCDVTATLAIAGVEALTRQKRIELPGAISLGEGLRLLPERDYASVSQVPAAAGVPGTETVQMAAIRGEEESTATQPAITSLRWQSRDRGT